MQLQKVQRDFGQTAAYFSKYGSEGAFSVMYIFKLNLAK